MTEKIRQVEAGSGVAFREKIRELKLERYELNLEAVVSHLADKVMAIPGDEVKVISLIGGAAAGKSTLADNLVLELRRRGIAADCISTDSFVVGNREDRRVLEKQKGPLAKYDFDYMRSLIRGIQDGSPEVRVPSYDNITGLAIAKGEDRYQHTIGKVDCLIVEGDFDVVESPRLRVYLHVADEVRLENRIRRDLQERSAAGEDEIKENFRLRHQQQHLPHTLPAIAKADIVLDASIKEDGKYSYSVYE